MNKEIQSHYGFIVVGAGTAGSVLAAELSASGAQVLVVESGGPDEAPTIANPSVWFYNVGGPLDYHLPVTPSPRLNHRAFDMALGRVLGGGSSINAMVWTRGIQRDYDGWATKGAKGWAFADVLPVFKSQEDWEGGANAWPGAGGPIHIRRPKNPHPTAPAFLDAAREMGMPILDDVNGPMVPGAGYINMNIAADGTRVSAARAFLHPARPRPNLTLLLNTPVVKLNFTGTRCVGAKIMTGGDERRKTVVYVHPNPSPDAVAHSLGLPDNLLDFPTDTNRAIAQMHYTNRFARTPNVKVHLLARRRVDSLLGRALRDHRRDGIHRGRRAARLRG